jgi:hypothetical protein
MLFGQALVLVAGVRSSLVFRSVNATLRLSDAFGGSRAGVRSNPMDVEPAIVAVRRASRFVPGATCLTQAIAARTLLARRGHSSTLHLGVAKEDGELKAHAWLEAGGRVVIGEFEDLHYTPLVQRRA